MTDEELRVTVYRGLASTGRAPSTIELATRLGTSEGEVAEALTRLAAQRHLVLGDDGAVVLAHPFATIDFGFSVKGQSTLWWGGCAWDSFAIPHLVPHEPSVLVATQCQACGAALAWVVTDQEAPAGDQVAHFLVPMARVWHDVVHACGNQRLFCSPDCVDRWLSDAGHDRGYVMDLAILWHLARGWYRGRLDPGYRRREPTEAAEYFREAGLRGPFWGL